MFLKEKTAIIIQARTGSTRLPDKMILPFFKNKTILDIVVGNLVSNFNEKNVLIATSGKKEDNGIETIARKHGIRCFRGDETDVLERFIMAAEEFCIENIIRVCADNPFIQPQYITNLINIYNSNHWDYISFAMPDGIPVIKTHFGFFAEMVTLEALKKTASFTSEKVYHEHVTNYIYTHPDKFKIHFLPVPKELEKRNDVRLTIDTKNDFDICSKIYSELMEKNVSSSIPEILAIIDNNKEYLKIMNYEIRRQKK